MSEDIKKLIDKLNNIEASMRFAERHYWLGDKQWFVGRYDLYIDDRLATREEIEEFTKLKKEFDS